MNYYFDNAEKQLQLKKILISWLDTPYRHRCGVRGKGTDCIHFVARVLQELKILRWRKDLIPDYPKDWHLHNKKELLVEGLEKELKNQYEKVKIEDLKNGDLTVAFYGKAISHAGFYFEGYVYQALNDIGVRKISIKDRVFGHQLRYAYRIIK